MSVTTVGSCGHATSKVEAAQSKALLTPSGVGFLLGPTPITLRPSRLLMWVNVLEAPQAEYAVWGSLLMVKARDLELLVFLVGAVVPVIVVMFIFWQVLF